MLFGVYFLLTLFALLFIFLSMRFTLDSNLFYRFGRIIESEERMPIAPSLFSSMRGFTWNKRVARNTRQLVAI